MDNADQSNGRSRPGRVTDSEMADLLPRNGHLRSRTGASAVADPPGPSRGLRTRRWLNLNEDADRMRNMGMVILPHPTAPDQGGQPATSRSVAIDALLEEGQALLEQERLEDESQEQWERLWRGANMFGG
ncbi:unnamed protein product [Diplocarpon coronariae]